jgi:hypothetical protein
VLKGNKAIGVWALAWFVIAIRIASGLFLPFSLLGAFINDFLTISHDLLWFLGLMILLEMTDIEKVYFPALYLLIHSIINALLHFGMKNRVYGAIATDIFAHPILLFILFRYFHICARVTKGLGARIVGLSFLLWAFDYIIFGVPYFGMGIPLAGVIGWTIGLIFRASIFIGYLMMAIGR